MDSCSQAGRRLTRHRTRVQHLHQQPDSYWRTERAAHDATLIRSSTANTFTLPSPDGFAEMGDTDWPFSKLCQEGW